MATTSKKTDGKPATIAGWKRLIKTIMDRHQTAAWLTRGSPEVLGAILEELRAAEQGLRDAEKHRAKSASFVTEKNLSALETLVLRAQGAYLRRDIPKSLETHIARCVDGGLAKWSPGQFGYILTDEGRTAIADRIIKRIGSGLYTDRALLDNLEATLAKLEKKR